jgi:hypothetical protein
MTLDEEDLPEKAKRSSTIAKRTKALSEKLELSRFQGEYAFKAQEVARCQFHDSHDGYSKFVIKCLDKMHVKMLFVELMFCDKCRNRGNNKLPPPFDLVRKLNKLSKDLSMFLTWGPEKWREPLFTSPWAMFLRSTEGLSKY